MLKKIILSLAIFLYYLNTSLLANWVKFGETHSAIHYINLSETSSGNRYIYYWVLTDYLEPQKIPTLPEGYSSKKVYKQTDCKRFRTSASQIILYKDQMSKGEPLINESYKESNFTTPNFESIGFEELEKICSYVEK